MDGLTKARLVLLLKKNPQLTIACPQCGADVAQHCRENKVQLERVHRQRLLDAAYDIESMTKAMVMLRAIQYIKNR